jgi:hypothetical protein
VKRNMNSVLTHRVVNTEESWGTYCGDWCRTEDIVVTGDLIDCLDCLSRQFEADNNWYRYHHAPSSYKLFTGKYTK